MPAARGHLGGIGAQALGMQPLDRPLHQRREILAAAKGQLPTMQVATDLTDAAKKVVAVAGV